MRTATVSTLETISSNPVLTLRTGFELELLAPRGSSRADLARELARRAGGRVRPVLHLDTEPSLVPGIGHFLHLTPGFAVDDAAGAPLATLVDDITITADLDARAPAMPGWYRLLSDEPRLIRLVARLADPALAMADTVAPIAAAFGSVVEAIGDAVRVDDPAGATVVIGLPVRGERERPCEIVTPPLTHDHEATLDALLSPARELGFTVPAEAAVHLHVDAAPFRTVPAFANAVRLFAHWRDALREVLGTNPRCVRLAPLPDALVALVEQPWRSWDELRAAARTTGLTKFFDVNLVKVIADRPDRHTVEVRILPGSLDAADVVRRAALVEALLLRCLDPAPLPRPTGAATAVDELRALAQGAA
ncbi:amidoligase family protein [Humibacter sp.]|uniref:amidoligase family protein n=1 Tax=Humibacter sp. TaxID=1940291 RepID=UPI002C62867E|nr:amidoligase family protein [Humibacter sp.]HVX09320.1 amidoligase family protein [Humibacter sp.]